MGDLPGCSDARRVVKGLRLAYPVAVIGAGASGVLTAAHLRNAVAELPLLLVDAGPRAARGLAYGTPYGAHLLNVPASNMGAYADDIRDFDNWLQARSPGTVYAPRRLYGEYLADVLDRLSRQSSATEHVQAEAIGLWRRAGSWEIGLDDERTVDANSVVLALGNLPPTDPFAAPETDRPRNYLSDQWKAIACEAFDPQERVLLIGTGLTMVDLVLALRSNGHQGRIHALSRRGLLPLGHPHQTGNRRNGSIPSGSPAAILRWLREEARRASRDGYGWQPVVDQLRPETQRLWESWSERERRSFLRHARRFWDVHRHRVAPPVAIQILALPVAGELQVHRGRNLALRELSNNRSVEARWRAPSGVDQTLVVDRVINCTGPALDYAKVELPLVDQLRADGWLVPDPLGLGIRTTRDGQLIDVHGDPTPGLYTLGPPRVGSLWESTAIPEIRSQAAALAALLTSCSRLGGFCLCN